MEEILKEIEKVLKKGKHMKLELYFCDCSGDLLTDVIIEVVEESKDPLFSVCQEVKAKNLLPLILEQIKLTGGFNAENTGTDRIH